MVYALNDYMASTPIIPPFGTSGRVRQVAVPPEARALSTLSHIDYEDAFSVEVADAVERTAEAWARAVTEDAPAGVRCRLRSGWLALGLKLGGAPPERSVLGWEIRRSTPEFVLLGADSRIGMPGELLFMRRQHTLLFCTFVRQDNSTVRRVWGLTERKHVRVVRGLLEQAAARAQKRPR